MLAISGNGKDLELSTDNQQQCPLFSMPCALEQKVGNLVCYYVILTEAADTSRSFPMCSFTRFSLSSVSSTIRLV